MLFFSVLLYANMLLQHVFAHGVLYSEFLNNTRNFVFLISLKFCLRIGVDCFLLDLVPRFKFVGLYVFILFGPHTFRFVAPNLPISHHLRPPLTAPPLFSLSYFVEAQIYAGAVHICASFAQIRALEA